MGKEQNDFAKDFESILKKTIEINKQYLKKGSELISDLNNSKKKNQNFNLLQPEIITEAFTSFTKLNLDHYKNMLDLGFELSKRAFSDSTSPEKTEEDNAEPAFILSGDLYEGSDITLQFLLDNEKKEEVNCRFVNSEFINENDHSDTHIFKTAFQPDLFELKSGASQAVSIKINVPPGTDSGNYFCKVQVLGFEPAYFLIKLNVSAKPKKPSGDGRRQKK